MADTAAIVPTFADLLRSWRKSRRLTQWTLALDTGISQRHLSFLESGRSSPSRDMVLRLARTLGIPLREQNVLLAAAGFAHVIRESRLDDEALRAARKALKLTLDHHEPFPACVLDRHWNLIEGNTGLMTLFSQFVDPLTVWNDIGESRANVIMLTLHPRGLRPALRNFHEIAGHMLARVSEELVRNPHDRTAHDLLERLCALPDMPAVPPTCEHAHPWLSMHLQSGDLDLRLFSMISTFGTPLDITLQEIRVETFFPADDASEVLIRSLSPAAPS